MNRQTISEKELRNYFLEVLAEIVNSEKNTTQLAELENKLYQKAFGIVEGNAFQMPELEFSGKVLIRKWIWALIIQGRVVPGSKHEYELPFLTITPEGEDWIKNEISDASIFFSSSSQYMDRLESFGVKLSSVAKDYVEEAVNAYYNNCPKSSMVMIGVAMEAMLGELYNALRKTEQSNWTGLLDGEKPYSYSKIIDKIDTILKQKTKDIKKISNIEKPMIFLTPMLEHLRQLRNDGAHASLPNHDINEAFAMLEVFIRTSTIISKLTAHLKNVEKLPNN